MKHVFTPAAERVLTEAAAWRSSDASDDVADDELLAALLLGLLSEPETRAALELHALGVDRAAVHARWPTLARRDHADGDPASGGESPARRAAATPALRDLIDRLKERLWDYPSPLEIATEHLLLGLLTGRDSAALWLRERGVDSGRVESGIHRRAGVRLPDESTDSPAPLDFEDDPPAAAPSVPANATASPVAINGHARPATVASPTSDRAVPARSLGPTEVRSLDLGVWRAIDASSNRAREALRVVEDYVRFVLDDRFLTERLKTLRHELTAIVKGFDRPTRLVARDTVGDVGTAIATAGEYTRADLLDAVAANFARLQEALRSLEEFGKLVDPRAAAGFERLRYAAYTLERATEIVARAVARLADARLYVLVDGRSSASEFESLVGSLVAAGVHALQLRDKTLADRELLDRAKRLRRLTAGASTLFVMNDRPDLARLAEADGVHVGQEELSVAEARAIVGPDALVGVSTHSIEQARRAVLDGADYLGVGPTFPSRTKSFDAFAGLDYVRAAAAEIRLPFFAIGGIDESNLSAVLAAGATRIAVSGAVCSQPDPAAAARRLLATLPR